MTEGAGQGVSGGSRRPARCQRCGTRLAGGSCPRCPGGPAETDSRSWLRRGVGDFAAGIGYFFRGAAVVASRPRYWHYVLVPFVLNVALFGVATYFALDWFVGVMDGLLEGSTYWAWAWYVLVVLFVGLVAAATFFGFALVGTLVAIPFSDFLSERLEAETVAGYREPPFAWRRMARETARAVWEALKLVVVQLVIMVGLVAIGYVPVVGLVVGLGGFAALAAVDFLDVIWARKLYGLGEKASFAWRYKARLLGFGVAMFAVLLVPVVNFLFIPVGVAGGTLLYLEAPRK